MGRGGDGGALSVFGAPSGLGPTLLVTLSSQAMAHGSWTALLPQCPSLGPGHSSKACSYPRLPSKPQMPPLLAPMWAGKSSLESVPRHDPQSRPWEEPHELGAKPGSAVQGSETAAGCSPPYPPRLSLTTGPQASPRLGRDLF